MWQANFKSVQLTAALYAALLAGGSQLAHAESDGSEIVITRNVAPRTAFRPDSPKSPKTVEVQVSPADRVTSQVARTSAIGSADDALMGNMRADQALDRGMANAPLGSGVALGGAAAGGASVGGTGRSAGGGGMGAALGVGGTVINAMSPLLPR
ncbi:hypothetical protein [Jeongeupia sp. USM3]|uniref:hypothetical protein n=1 Tax=Jeongeupia sp. USM3 TaxID=1906741 RepID=UPI00089DF6D7|nr:hypothetical protein [Jeongeupia sp. USM3]AOY00606.1 hypothetical protein BJP62_09240 [Jeongeupia sp. USM3]